MPTGKSVTLCRISPGITGVAQREDVYFFRPWKEYDRAICDHVMMENLEHVVVLHQRNERVKRQSLIGRQFCAPRYAPMIRYAFYACAYLRNKKSGRFDNPVEYCFHSLSAENLLREKSDCGEVSFMKCSWCEKMLCFDCFYVKYHNCSAV